MPLRAELNGEILFSHKMTTDEWEQLKKSQDKGSLVLPCCNQRAIMKTSSLGTKFFAHYRKSENCIYRPESKEHLRLKSIVASAAESAGWSVTTEYVGYSKDGEKWIADVYCTKGKAKVALEIQLSTQTQSELTYRHERYTHSGVRDAWFMKSNVYKSSGSSSKKEFPRFEITNFMWDSQTPQVSHYELSLLQFVKKLLGGDLVWVEDNDEEFIYYMESTCWKCSKELKIPIGLGNSESSNFDSFIKTVPNCSTFYKSLMTKIGGEKLLELGLTAISSNPNLKGNAPNFPYCVQCSGCGASQNNYYTLQNYHDWWKSPGRDSRYVVLSRYAHNGRYELAR